MLKKADTVALYKRSNEIKIIVDCRLAGNKTIYFNDLLLENHVLLKMTRDLNIKNKSAYTFRGKIYLLEREN